MTTGALSVRCLIEISATGDQSLQPSSSQTNGHQITQTHTQSKTVAIAERTTVSTGLQPDVNNGDRLFGEHAARRVGRGCRRHMFFLRYICWTAIELLSEQSRVPSRGKTRSSSKGSIPMLIDRSKKAPDSPASAQESSQTLLIQLRHRFSSVPKNA